MFKSSSLTSVYKYVAMPLLCGLFAVLIAMTWTTDDQSFNDSAGVTIWVSWISVWHIIVIIRLRSIEATRDGLIIKKFSGQETIGYNDIEYVFQIAMVNPILISLKYHNRRTGESHKILIMPGMRAQMFRFNFLEEVDTTKFIRQQVVKANPGYNTDSEPSRWLPFGLMVLTGIPILLIVHLFLGSFDKL